MEGSAAQGLIALQLVMPAPAFARAGYGGHPNCGFQSGVPAFAGMTDQPQYFGLDSIAACPYLAVTMTSSIDELKSDFAILEDWEERYRHVIELGKGLPPMDNAFKTPATKVSGCASQVWIFSRVIGGPNGKMLALTGDSDALIVKGLIAIAFMIFAPLTVSQIIRTDAVAIFKELGLSEHLTPQRSNGLASMVRRIKADAAAAG